MTPSKHAIAIQEALDTYKSAIGTAWEYGALGNLQDAVERVKLAEVRKRIAAARADIAARVGGAK